MRYIFLFFRYIHLYPKRRNFNRVMRVAGMKRGISYQTFLRYVKPLAKRLSEVISEIQFENRLARDNHHPNFPRILSIKVSNSVCIEDRPTLA